MSAKEKEQGPRRERRMASPGSVWGFWKTVQTISPRAIEEEASIGFRFALIGTPEQRDALKDSFLTDRATDLEREDAANHWRDFDESPDADTARGFSFVLYAADAGEPIGLRGKNSVPVVGNIEQIVEGVLEQRPDLAVALARRFPRFRVPACNRIIRDVSKVNAYVALISALPGVLPITGIFLPVSSMADVILLTKNQIVLVMRLAAAHGQRPAYTKQIKEMIGTVGSALGWRTLARELVGMVPAGVGVALKTSIAYSGTMAVGKSALWFYQKGKMPTKDEIRAAYSESEAEAKEVADSLQKEVRREQSAEGDSPATNDSAA
jgi:uncharacterized protein (DUF697 family)